MKRLLLMRLEKVKYCVEQIAIAENQRARGEEHDCTERSLLMVGSTPLCNGPTSALSRSNKAKIWLLATTDLDIAKIK